MDQVIQTAVHFVIQVPWVALELVVETGRRSTQTCVYLIKHVKAIVVIVVQYVQVL